MPRESRHVWVGNLPEKVKEEEVAEYFSRYGRVEKIKLLPKISPDGGRAAFVDFVDIRSATKANEAQNSLGGRDLRTNYNEPGHKHHQNHDTMHRMHGSFPPGINYRQPPVVIYATPPVDHTTQSFRQVYHRDDRSRSQGSSGRRERGRSPGSKGSLSDADRSPSPQSRSRGGGYSSGSDVSEKDGKCTVYIKNISPRSTDSSLEESLYHEFKKYGEIMNIIIKGNSQDKYAYVQFSKPDEAEDATKSSGKLFLGQEIKVSVKGSSSRSRSSTILEDLAFDPHATRTIFVGNIDKNMVHGDLKNIFDRFGEVVEIDIKKMQAGITTYAFIQFIDINGATLAKRKMDRQAIGNNRIKVGYGRGTPTNSLWVGNLPAKVSEHEITKSLTPFGHVQRCLIDKKLWQALVRFETIESCTKAFAEMHGKSFGGKRLAVDYASPACRNAFYNRMERHGYLDRRQLEASPTPPDSHINFQNAARGGPFQPRGSYNYPKEDDRDRYDKERYRARSPNSRASISPRRKTRDSVSPDSSNRSDSRNKRKWSVGKSPERNLEPLKKKEKKKKKDKLKKKNKEGVELVGGDGVLKTKAELKKEKKERKKVEKLKKKAEKKEKKMKKQRMLEEKRMSMEGQVKIGEKDSSKAAEGENKNYTELNDNDGISDISQITEDLNGGKEESTNLETKENIKDDIVTQTEENKEQKKEITEKVDEKPTANEEDENTESEAGEIKSLPDNTENPALNDSSGSSSSSSSSSDSDDSEDSSDDERKSRKTVIPKPYNDQTNRDRSREPKAYRQDPDTDRRERDYREHERDREYSRSKYSDYYRSSSSKDTHRTRSPNYRGRSRSRSPYRKDNSYDKRRGRSPGRSSPRYNRPESRNEKRQERTPPPPPPNKDSRKDGTMYPVSSSAPSQSTDTLLDLLRRFPVMWQGLLGLKNDTAAVQMHYLSGNLLLAEQSLPRSAQPNEVPPPLRISQRMKLEPSQLEGVDKRIQNSNEHCMLLALPCGRDPLDVHAQTRALKTGFITYLQQKQAAGIINVPDPTNKQPLYVVHIFPPCEFAQGHLVRVAPDLLDSAVDSGHLMVLITPI